MKEQSNLYTILQTRRQLLGCNKYFRYDKVVGLDQMIILSCFRSKFGFADKIALLISPVLNVKLSSYKFMRSMPIVNPDTVLVLHFSVIC